MQEFMDRYIEPARRESGKPHLLLLTLPKTPGA